MTRSLSPTLGDGHTPIPLDLGFWAASRVIALQNSLVFQLKPQLHDDISKLCTLCLQCAKEQYANLDRFYTVQSETHDALKVYLGSGAGDPQPMMLTLIARLMALHGVPDSKKLFGEETFANGLIGVVEYTKQQLGLHLSELGGIAEVTMTARDQCMAKVVELMGLQLLVDNEIPGDITSDVTFLSKQFQDQFHLASPPNPYADSSNRIYGVYEDLTEIIDEFKTLSDWAKGAVYVVERLLGMSPSDQPDWLCDGLTIKLLQSWLKLADEVRQRNSN